ncbi:hypothetical protein WI70_30315 [Burkholderia cepacia]|nr:hypothetical protein WI47_23750 [Burkholderia cepacia]KVC33256.1 hypothetical protein WI70_30315 [Burkholderia cepacia]
MPAENLSQEKSPAPEQASEAADQRPSTENSTAEGIVDVRAAGGNGTSSKVGRADAMTRESIEAIARKYAGAYFSGLMFQDADSFARFSDDLILAAFPFEQPAAAPTHLASPTHMRDGTVIDKIVAKRLAIQFGLLPQEPAPNPALSPTDERAAFPRYTEWLHLRTHGEWSSGVPAWARDHTGRMNDFTAASAVIEELAAARASSANGTGAEVVRAWETDDGRVISDEQKQQALRDGGASASSVRPFSIALGRIGAVPAMAAEAVAWKSWKDGDGYGFWDTRDEAELASAHDFEPEPLYAAPQPAQAAMPVLTNAMRAVITNESGAYQSADDLYAALCAAAGDERPAQADARVGLTDALRRAREELSIIEWENDPPARVTNLFSTIDALLGAHPGQPEPHETKTDLLRASEPRA